MPLPMRNPLQDQLLKAGLVKKSKAAQIVREQTRQRHGRSPQTAESEKVDAARLQAERDGEIAYAFNDDGRIKRLLVDDAQRAQLAKGTLVIVRHDQGHELIPRPAAEKVYARDGDMIVLDNARASAPASNDEDDDFYKQFEVPDDLIW